MLRTVVVGAIASAAVVTAMVLVVQQPAAQAKPGTNLEIYPKGTDLKVIKKDMKVISKSLGVQCDFCHDLDDFAADSNKHKKVARDMMRMVTDINKQLKKDGYDATVSCMTCHQGKEHPPK